MINSLRKDSHITQSICHPKMTYNSGGSASKNKIKEYCNAPLYNSIGISVRKPAEINFRGLSSAKLANSKNFKLLINSARNIAGKDKKQHQQVVNLIKEAISVLVNKKINNESYMRKFIADNKKTIESIVEDARTYTKEEFLVKINDPNNPNKKIPKLIPDKKDKTKMVPEYRQEPEDLEKEAINSITTAAEVFPAVEKPHKFYQNKIIQKSLLIAEKNNVAFSASFALLLTCIFRPASIMMLPGGKKNNDDKKYAAAHSIASGFIGYVVAAAVSNPIADALKNVLDDPSKYIKNKDRATYLEASIKANRAANTWISRSVDIAMAVPKALITIALIPIILKYIFGWEKQKHFNNQVNLEQNNSKTADIENKKTVDNKVGGLK